MAEQGGVPEQPTLEYRIERRVAVRRTIEAFAAKPASANNITGAINGGQR